MQELTTVLTLVASVSVASERVTEIIKGMFGYLADKLEDPGRERRRRAALQILAGGVGTVIAWQGGLAIGSHTGPFAWGVIGAMSSGGSTFWNHALDAMRATKLTKQLEADCKQAAADEAKALAAAAKRIQEGRAPQAA